MSIQGEGAHAGLPCFFIRLSGCNLRCSYCDTQYAYKGGTERDINDLTAEWKRSGINLVQITGGEPLLQPGVYSLMEALLGMGAEVLLETNGSLSIKDVPSKVVKVVDRKTPGSGESGAWKQDNLRFINRGDQIKFVITDRDDYMWAKKEVASNLLTSYAHVIFSAAWDVLSPSDLASWIIEDRLAVRFQMQLHKILWGNVKESDFF